MYAEPDDPGLEQLRMVNTVALLKRAKIMGKTRRFIRQCFYPQLIIGLSILGGCDQSPNTEVDIQSSETSEIAASVREAPEWPTDGALVYVSNEDSGDVSIISTATNEVVTSLSVGRRPRGIKVSYDGKKLFVALSGSPKCPPSMADEECEKKITDKTQDGIAVVDLLTARVERVLPGGSDPEQFDVSADNRRLFVSNEDSDEATIVDIASGKVIQTIPVTREPEGVRISPDGALVYVTGETDHNVTVLDATSGAVVATIGVGLRPRDAVFTTDGSRAFVSAELAHSIAVVNVKQHEVVATIELDETAKPVGMAISSDDQRLYVANGRGKTVSAIDLNTLEVIGTVEVGPRPWGIGLTDDERFLYTANGPSDDVSVIETESMQVVTTIRVGASPWGIAIGPIPR
ncbi:MAG: beta-propeller fold lactonase family protein [Gammaproteobacteria bacterium]|nr:beta-propeller fold lactonase family protein [Gammaproteobacteria bacterium]